MDVNNLLESPEIKYIHFIGIGGISMSGLAEILLDAGYRISGSDIRPSNITRKLEALGAEIHARHSGENISGQDLVVYTAAVKSDNPELIRARALGMPVIDRATLLGLIMKRYPYSVAVSGTHGKTTTTSMAASIMLEAGLDPTIHIGGELESIGGNTKVGGSRYFIAEACEYVESFLKFYPYVGVILNIELDHVDYFRDIEHLKEAFLKFAMLIPKDGYLVAYAEDPNVASLLDKVNCKRVTFGLKPEAAMWSAGDVRFDDMGRASFDLLLNREKAARISLNIPGLHNVKNALAAAAACQALGCGFAQIRDGLAKFNGAKRRFELKGVVNGINVIDDYAHHPSEIKATLKAARGCSYGRIWCVFQPHTYTRTKSLLNEFSSAFHDADNVIVADIYAAREADRGEIHSSTLADRINSVSKNALYLSGFENIAKYLEQNVKPGDLVLTMGAGDIYKAGEMFLKTGIDHS